MIKVNFLIVTLKKKTANVNTQFSIKYLEKLKYENDYTHDLRIEKYRKSQRDNSD